MTANASDKDAQRPAPAGADAPQPEREVKVKDRRHAAASAPSAEPADELSDADAATPDEPKASATDLQLQLMQARLAASESRLSATLAQYKEALEEFEGVKARLKRDIGKEIDAGKRTILSALLEVLDNLERAIEAAAPNPSAGEGFYEGVSMVRDQFRHKLQAMGVVRRDALGAPFDPDHFEAISTVPVADAAQDGTVVGVVRHCYMLGEETLRHGMVAVGKHG